MTSTKILIANIFLGKRWVSGDSFGAFIHNSDYIVFPLWKSNIWNKFCISADVKGKSYKIVMNGDIVFKANEYDGQHIQSKGNIFLLNGYSYREDIFAYPFKGEITDVNIWDTILKENEIENWSKCITNETGNVLDWSTAEFNLNNVSLKEIERQTICENPVTESFIAFSDQINFAQSIKFCENLGGSIAEAKNKEDLKNILKAFRELGNRNLCSQQIYSGYRKQDGNYRNINTGELLKWNDNWGTDKLLVTDCAIIDIRSGKFEQNHCNFQLCPVCHFKNWPQELQLRGMKIDMTEEVDSSYFLVNSSHLMGKAKSQIIANYNGWNILDFNKKVTFYNENQTFPLGLNRWKRAFENENHLQEEAARANNLSDIQLFLHRALEQPGHFCCNDGSCISSELVCDDYEHCTDGSDEEACQRVKFKDHYEKSIPPKPYNNENFTKSHYLKLHTDIKILDIIDIDQGKKTCSLFIRLTFKGRLDKNISRSNRISSFYIVEYLNT